MTDQPMDYGFTQDWQEAQAKTIQAHLNPLPRSVVRRNDYALLDGEWLFELDLEDVGLRERWYVGHDYKGTIVWPTSIEEQMASAQDSQQSARPWEDQLVAWYEREFTVPAQWLKDRDSLVQLTFGACGYETRVWLNGHPLSTVEGETIHLGEYTSFSYELPPQYLQEVNRLTVRTADSLDSEIPRGKQESRVFKRGGIWYQTISGPIRSIWLEPVQRNRLRSRLGVISTIEDGLVEFVVTIRTQDPNIYTLRMVVSPRGGPPIASCEHRLALEAGERQQRVVVQLPGASLWSPSNPALYHVVAQLSAQNTGISQIETHFGVRKIEARGQSIYLNNERIYLDGILYQPNIANYEQIKEHMHAMKRLGCNMVRLHIAGVDPRIYDLADEMGMLLWIEVPSPHSSTQRSRDNHWAELMRMLVIAASHPSIVCLSLYNEDWGAQDIAHNALTREYIARTFSYLRVNYPQILVVDNDGWNHVSTEGRIESHLLTGHIYTPDLNRWSRALDGILEGDLKGVMGQSLVVGDPFFYNGQVPMVVSEWGGFGWSGYGGPTEGTQKAEQIAAYKRELRRRPIAGDVYTQAVSIEEEVNGLLDPETGELFVPEGILASDGVEAEERAPGG